MLTVTTPDPTLPLTMPPPAPPAPPAPQAAPVRAVVTKLRSPDGREYAWTAELAEVDGMLALDQYGRVVPNAPRGVTPRVTDPGAELNPAINGVAQQSDLVTLRGEIAALRDALAQAVTRVNALEAQMQQG